jgi:hypothetical protein
MHAGKKYYAHLVLLHSVRQLLVTDSVAPSSPILDTFMKGGWMCFRLQARGETPDRRKSPCDVTRGYDVKLGGGRERTEKNNKVNGGNNY